MFINTDNGVINADYIVSAREERYRELDNRNYTMVIVTDSVGVEHRITRTYKNYYLDDFLEEVNHGRHKEVK